jgi:hypothetical protein
VQELLKALPPGGGPGSHRVEALEGGAGVRAGAVWLKCGDLMKLDVSDASVVWCAGLCFSDDFLRSIAQKLLREAPGSLPRR